MTYNQLVLDGAKFLDDNAGKWSWLTADWRQKIYIDKLDMRSLTGCILGQLEGNFDTAVDMIEDDLGRDKWIEVSNCFSNWTGYWKDYLRGPCRPSIGSVWVNSSGTVARKVLSVFEDEGTDLVSYKSDSVFYTTSLSEFFAGFCLKPVIRFKKGDLLKADPGTFYAGNTFLYLSNDRVIMFHGDKTPQYCNLAWYERETGKLTHISTGFGVSAGALLLKDISGDLLDLTE